VEEEETKEEGDSQEGKSEDNDNSLSSDFSSMILGDLGVICLLFLKNSLMFLSLRMT